MPPALVLPALAAVLLYIPVIGFGVTNFDDNIYVSENDAVRAGLGLRGLAWALGGFHAGYYIPVTWLSLMADASLYGPWPGGFHLTNALLHAANVFLYGWLLQRWTGRLAPSVAAAFLLAVHPLHVESVAWVTERKDVLAMFLLLIALHLHRSWLGDPAGANRGLFLGAFALSLLAKPMGVVLPVLLLLLERWPLGRRTGPGRQLADLAPVAALSTAAATLTLAGHWLGQVVAPLGTIPIGRRLATCLAGFGWYLRKALWPDVLAVHYRLPPAGPSAAALFLSAGLLAAFCLAAWRWRREQPALGVGLGWYAAALVPVSGLFQAGIQATADRFAYLPLAGAYMAATWTASRSRVPAAAVHRAVVVALAALTAISAAQLPYWRDSGSLFSRALTVDPDDPVARANLGSFLLERRRYAEAEEHLRRALAMDPGNVGTRVNLADALVARGMTAEAVEEYRRVAAPHPEHRRARFSLALALARLGETDAALLELDGILAVSPGFAEAHYQKGLLLAMKDLDAQARVALEEAVRLDPGFGPAHHNLGVVLMRLGETTGGERHLAEAGRLGVREP
ncbi:MAG TPA: tetratricopeptide repeat protein [bacterium]